MLVFKGFKDDRCPLHASALTFISVMALVPFLVIVFSLAKGFGVEKASEMFLEQTLEMPEAIQHAITNIISTVESASARAMGGIGGLLVLWIAIKMLSSIEETFNLVWGVKISRSFIDKTRNYIVIIAIAPFLLVVSNIGQPILMGLASQLEWMGPALKIGLQMGLILILTLAFSIVYLFLPNTKVKFSAALTGALTAALLTIFFQFLISKLGVGVSKYNKIYGALAAIPIFLFWVQANWMILLMGAEVAFSAQHAGTYAREQLAVTPSTRAKLCLAFVLMKHITTAFESPNAPFDAHEFGTKNHIPVRLINDITRTLAQAGLITESAEHPACYTLLNDPRNITAHDITQAIFDVGASPQELGLSTDLPMLEAITTESFQSLDKQILKNF